MEKHPIIIKNLKLRVMMPFSTRTGLERVVIDGPELELSLGRSAGSGRWTPLQK